MFFGRPVVAFSGSDGATLVVHEAPHWGDSGRYFGQVIRSRDPSRKVPDSNRRGAHGAASSGSTSSSEHLDVLHVLEPAGDLVGWVKAAVLELIVRREADVAKHLRGNGVCTAEEV